MSILIRRHTIFFFKTFIKITTVFITYSSYNFRYRYFCIKQKGCSLTKTFTFEQLIKGISGFLFYYLTGIWYGLVYRSCKLRKTCIFVAIIYILKVLICCPICYYYYKSVLCSFFILYCLYLFILWLFSLLSHFNETLLSWDQLSIDLLIIPILDYLVATDLRTVCTIEVYYKVKICFTVWKGKLTAIMNFWVKMACSWLL